MPISVLRDTRTGLLGGLPEPPERPEVPRLSETPRTMGLERTTALPIEPLPIAPLPIEALSTSRLLASLPSKLRLHLAEVARPSLYELTRHARDVVSLPEILRALAATPSGAATVKDVLDRFTAHTGVTISEAARAQILRDPSRLGNAVALSPDELNAGFDSMLAAYRAGLIKDAAPKLRNLPAQFDLSLLADPPVPDPVFGLKKIAPGLYRGDRPGPLTPLQAKRNIAMAEVFDRLAENSGRSLDERFGVVVGGRTLTTLSEVLREFRRRGDTIEVRFAHRVANFTDLKTKGDDEPDHLAKDVPAAMMIRTGVFGRDGEEAMIPACHAEMIISIAGQDGPFDVKFFQGMDATGFFPRDVTKVPEWTGWAIDEPQPGVTHISGDAAIDLVVAAARMSDLVNDVAKEKGLPFGAYGVTGVCMDSVQVILHQLGGELRYYPLLMRDAVLVPDIEERLLDSDRSDDRTLRAILASMKAVPSDVSAPAPIDRILRCLPWPRGSEIFESTTRARAILESALEIEQGLDAYLEAFC